MPDPERLIVTHNMENLFSSKTLRRGLITPLWPWAWRRRAGEDEIGQISRLSNMCSIRDTVRSVVAQDTSSNGFKGKQNFEGWGGAKYPFVKQRNSGVAVMGVATGGAN